MRISNVRLFSTSDKFKGEFAGFCVFMSNSTQIVRDVSASMGISSVMLYIMGILGFTNGGAVPVNLLRSLCYIDRSYMGELLRRLEKLGYVKTERGVGRRTGMVSITPDGTKFMERVEDAVIARTADSRAGSVPFNVLKRYIV